MEKLERFLDRAEGLLSRLEVILPSSQQQIPDWQSAAAFRWDHQQRRLHPVPNFQRIALSDLLGIDEQKQRIRQNTLQFVRGGTANNVLLSGARGTGKSSLVKALLNEYAAQGLRVIQIDKQGLIAAFEVMIATAAIRTMIRENRMHQALAAIETSRKDGMFTIDHSLQALVSRQAITRDEAQRVARNPKLFE